MATFSSSHLPSRQIEALLVPGGGSIGENINDLKSSTSILPVHIGFSGGVEMLFSNKKSLDLTLPLVEVGLSNSDTAGGDAAASSSSSGSLPRPLGVSDSSTFDLNRSVSMNGSNVQISSEQQWTLRKLINLLTSRYLRTGDSNLFLKGDNLRPGILVVVNDVDWELLGKHDYVLQPNDDVMFISTLHGG